MAGEIQLTVEGNLTNDPDLKTLNSGANVASFTVASNERKFNKQTNQWENSSSVFMRCSTWNELALNVSASLHKGNSVIVTGTLKQREYTDNNGVKRTVIEMTVNNIGPSLKWATAQVQRNQQNSQQTQQQQNGQQNQQQYQQDDNNGIGQDPWANDTVEPEF
jgi:single-strand DNA-binding protein